MNRRAKPGSGGMMVGTVLLVLAVPQDSAAIYGGEVAIGAPPASAVHLTMKRGSRSASCSGTLVGPRLVLTAAHCIRPPSGGERRVTAVRIGHRKTGFVRRRVSHLVIHPQFDAAQPSRGFDIAILRLKKPVRKFSPVRLGSREESPQLHGDRVFARGFGLTRTANNRIKRSKKLRQAKLEVLRNCFGSSNPALRARVNAQIFCAASPSQGVCHGDSGGPVVRRAGDREALVGVISNVVDRRQRCADGMLIATRLSNVMPWLQSQLAMLSKK